MTQQYGTVKVDVITYTSGTGGSETDQSITVSSLATISRTGIAITGDISANNIYISGVAQVSGLATVSGLVVGQDATITGNLLVGSGLQASSLVVQDNATVSGALGVSGLATVSGLTVTADTSLNNLTATGATNLNTLTATGATNLNTLTATGDTSLNNLTATGATNLNTLTVTGDTSLNNLTATGATNLNTLIATGDTSLNNLTATGATNLNTLTATGDSNFEDVAVSGNLTVTGNATISGNLTVSGDLNASGVTISGFTGLFASGTNAAPSISFVDDEDTGIYHPANNNTIAITTSGEQQLRVDEDGTVAIGGNDVRRENLKFGGISVTPLFQIEDTDADSSISLTRNTDSINASTIYLAKTRGSTVSGLTIVQEDDRYGTLSFNGSDGVELLQGAKIEALADNIVERSGMPGRLLFSTTSSGSITPTGRMIIDSVGNIGVGTNYLPHRFQVRTGGAEITTIAIQDPTNQQYGAHYSFYDTANYCALGGMTDNVLNEVIRWPRDTTQQIFINDTGVGIGTQNPTELFQVEGQEVEILARNTLAISGSLGDQQVFKFGVEGQKNGNFKAAGSIIFRQDNSTWSSNNNFQGPTRIEFCTQNLDNTTDTSEVPRLVINNQGEIGVGIDIPEEFVHLRNADVPTIKATKTNSISDTNGTAAISKFIAQGQKNGNYKNAGSIIFRQDAATWSSLDNFQGPTRIEFCTQNTDPDTDTSETPQVVIDREGQVGINTSTPTAFLHIGNLTQAGTDEDLLRIDRVGGTALFDLVYNSTENAVKIEAENKAYILNNVQSKNESLRVTPLGQFLTGTSSARANFFFGASAVTPRVQTERNSASASISVTRSQGDSNGPTIYLGKSRGAVNSATVVVENDTLGTISFNGADGTNLVQGAMIQAQVDGTPGSNDMPSRLVFRTSADGSRSPTEHVRINSLGECLFKTTNMQSLPANNATGFMLNQQGSMVAQRGSSGRYAYFYNNTNSALIGSIQNSGGTSVLYNTSSDYRLKENIVPLTNAIERLSELSVRRFNFISNPSKTIDGFLAHEAQAVVPEAVTGCKDEVDEKGDPIYQGIDPSKLVPLLTAALQEAVSEINELKERVKNLES